MDTDDLSREAYAAILLEAEKLTHDLTLHYGVLSGECADEMEYLDKAESLTQEFLEYDEYDLEDLLWGNVPDTERLHRTLRKIISNIEEVRKIPEENRHYDF